MRTILCFLFFLFAWCPSDIYAQDTPPDYFLKAEEQVIEFLKSDTDQSIYAFIREAMNQHAVENPDSLFHYLKKLREHFRPFLGDLGIEGSPHGLLFMFSNEEGQKNLMIRLSPEGILELAEQDPEQPIVISSSNLSEVVDSLEHIGMAGLLYVRKNGEEIINRPFGYANEELGIPNNEETIFGIGSRPIDFTVAAILLLDQKGKLSLDDPLTTFYKDVPDDHREITIRHLMTGRSGLPDFFETDEDWNPDLAWIDRKEAEQRLLNIPLLFKPGSDQQHSHAAFGLLAAIVERVSGQEYYAFIREHFLDPAGMTRTGEYGERRGLSLKDFAVGGGPEKIGLPNIPPNWGPTSWLVKGSGGMYSTLEDLQKFYSYVRSYDIFDEEHRQYFMNETISLDGSMRGFELFSISDPGSDTEVYFFVNNLVDRRGFRRIFMGLERFVTR